MAGEVESLCAVEVRGSGAGEVEPGPAPSLSAGPRRRAQESLGRILAMLLLPLSVAPVLLLGPSLLRAPVTLGHEAWGDVQRLEQSLQPAHDSSHPAGVLRLGPSAWSPVVSLGTVYGRWSAFPETGRTGFTYAGYQHPESEEQGR